MNKIRKISDDLICGIVVFVFFLSIFLQTLDQKSDVVALPKVISGIGMLSGVCVAVSGAREKHEITRDGLCSLLVLLAGTILIGCAMMLAPYLGFYIMLYVVSVLLLAAVQFACGETNGRSWIRTLLTGGVFCGALYLIFSLILKIQTPTGILF